MRRPRGLTGPALVVTLVGCAPLAGVDRGRTSPAEYYRRESESVSREAYERAAERLCGTSVGMSLRDFLGQMEMVVLEQDRRPIYGYVEGHLRKESIVESAESRPTRVLIFGWYEDPVERRHPVPRLRVVVEDDVVAEITTIDETDERGQGR